MSRTKLADESIKLLRQRLDEIDGSTAEEIALHRERVEDLRSEYDHSIRYLDAGCARTDCVEYALNIPSDLINIAATFNSILEGFWLTLPKRLGEIPESEVSNGRVVLYFADGKMKHVGRIVQGTRVVSKWGKNPIYEHDLCEVPTSYGDEFEFFEQPSDYYVTSRFIDFVRHHCRYVDIRETFEEFVSELDYIKPRRQRKA